MIQNDISKRHQNDINDKSLKNLEMTGIFSNPLERTLLTYVRKIGKIVSAIYLVTDVMDQTLPLAGALRNQSLELLNHSYGVMTGGKIGADDLSRVLVRIEQVVTLVEIGSIAHHISAMNADILMGEMAKIKELLSVDIQAVKRQEKAFVIHRPMAGQSMIPDGVIADKLFDQLVERHESKRHQNDIKTTMVAPLAQNDIQNDKLENKTTFKTTSANWRTNDIDRKQEILGIIKTRHSTTMQDIKNAFKEYSEKTIQREIATLMEMGLVRREGNKRWAVYRAV